MKNPILEFFMTARNIMVKERVMMDVMNALTDKPEWNRKVFDEEIAAKWKEEGLRMSHLITPNAMDYVRLSLPSTILSS